MARMESTVVIERPLEEVFRFLLDLEAYGRLVDPDIETVTKTPPGPIGAGTTFDVHRSLRTPLGLIRRRDFLRYTAIEPNRRIDFEASFGPIAPTGSLTFEHVERDTRVTFRGEPNPVGPFKLLTRLIARRGQSVWDQRLARAKAIMESKAG